MIDWLVLLIPLVLLPIVLLLGFLGCQVFFPIDEYEDENIGTTTGSGPVNFIGVEVEIADTCEATANAIDIVLTTDITMEQASFTLTTISPEAQTLSTKDLKITLEDEGQVFCAVVITPAEGQPPSVPPTTHPKVKGESVPTFSLSCKNGFELT